MTTIRDPEEKDYIKFAPAMFFAMKQKNANEGYYLIVDFDGAEKLLQVIGKKCYLYSLNYDKEVTYSEFLLDDEYYLDFAAISEDYVVSIEQVEEDRDNDEFLFVNNHNGNLEEFDFKPREDPDPDGYNGYVVYSQYNNETDTRVMLVYQHMIQPDNRVYGYHLNNPSYIIIDRDVVEGKKPKKERYVRKDFKYLEDPISYNLATMKEHGVMRTLMEGAVEINAQADFSKYYHIWRETPKEIKIAFPFGAQYNLEDIFKYIKGMGFNTYVPDEIVKFYNGDVREFKEMMYISQILRQAYELSKEDIQKLNLKKEDKDGNN